MGGDGPPGFFEEFGGFFGGVEDKVSVGVDRGFGEEALSDFVMELERFAVDAVGGFGAVGGLESGEADFGGEVEEEGQVGGEALGGGLVELA